MPEPEHRHPLQVRWSDVDAYGHVNNVMYFEYFQEARIELIGVQGSSPGARSYVVARTRVEHRAPMLFRAEPYVVVSQVVRLGRSSFDIAARVCDDPADGASGAGEATVYARSTCTVVGFDTVTQRSRPLDDAERAHLQRHGPPPEG